MSFTIIAISVISIMAIAIPGFILVKTKMVNGEKAIPSFSTFLFYVTSPVLTFVTFQAVDYSNELMQNIGLCALLALVMFLVLSALALLIGRPKKSDVTKRILTFASIYPNCTFIGIPLFQAIFPGNPLPIIYCSVISSVFNMITWTIGLYIMTGDKKYISVKKAFLNPATIGVLIAIPVFISGFRIAEFLPTLANLLGHLGNATAPISMTILGMRLATMPLSSIFLRGKNYLTASLKLLVAPALIFALSLLIPNVDRLLVSVLIIVSAMPSATSTVLFAEKHTDSPETASSIFVLSTLLAIISLPLVLMII